MVEFDDNLNPVRPEEQNPQPNQPSTPQPQPSWSPSTPPPTPTPPPHQAEEPSKPLPQMRHHHQPFGSRPGMPTGTTMLFPLIFLIVLIAGGFWFFSQNGNSIKPGAAVNGPQEGLSVSADGTVYATPDIAKLRFGVQESGKDATVTQDAISKKIDSIKSKLSELGVEDKDIQTVEFGIYPDYGSAPVTTNTKIRSYTGRHMLQVTIHNLAKANSVSSAVVAAGANEVQNIEFTVQDPEAWYQQARSQAITKAKDKAKQLAKDAGISLGRLLSINEYTNSGPIYYKDMPVGIGGSVDSSAAPSGIEPGSLELQANVTLVYQIR